MNKIFSTAKSWIWLAIIVFAILLFLPIFCNCYYLTVDSFLNTIENYYTLVIALGGVVGVIINLIYTRKRIDLQGQQLANQDKQLRNEQFTAAVTQLGHESESVRLGGIYSLYALAEEYPKEYLNNVCDVFCAHIKTTTRAREYQMHSYRENPSIEIQTIIDFLFKKKNEKETIFKDCTKKISQSYFARVNFEGATISNSNFNGAKISNSNFSKAMISNSYFNGAEISENYNFIGTKISRTYFNTATISENNFSYARFEQCSFIGATMSNNKFYETEIVENRNKKPDPSKYQATKSDDPNSTIIDDQTLNTIPEETKEQIEKHRKK